MTDEFEILWNGEKDRYLCIPDDAVRAVRRVRPMEPMAPEPERHPYGAARLAVLKTLAARASWKTGDLGKACGLERRVMHMILCREHRKGTIRRPSYGVVALVTRQVA